MAITERKPTQGLAIVTGASSGIGYELAKCCANDGYNLLVVADKPEIHQAAEDFKLLGINVEAIQTDLSTAEGVETVLTALNDRPVDALLANAGHGLGGAFLDQDFIEWKHVIDTNITGTLYLIQKVALGMRDANHGRILITGSIAGFMPGTYQAVYNGSKAFIDSFSFALRHELQDHGVTVSCLMPGATETDFFARANMLDTKVGQSQKQDPAEVAQIGYEAMVNGEGDVVSGWMNKLQTAMASITPSDILAEQHAKMAKPLTKKKAS